MIKYKIINYQNLAYCRYIQLWSILSIFNIIKITPLFSLYIIFIVHLFIIEFTSKRIGITLIDIILINVIHKFNKKLYVYYNFIFFIFYILIIITHNINPIKLYTIHLKNDDNLHKNENIYKYLIRIWKLFIFNN